MSDEMTQLLPNMWDRFISDRAKSIDTSGIRRVFELGAKLKDPINLSIGQPDFPVPQPIKQATIEAIQNDRNGYTLTQGAPELLEATAHHLRRDIGWEVPSDDLGLMITSGTSGAMLLAAMALLNGGDEVVIADPYFVIYPAHARICGARPVFCDTYPDFRLNAERAERVMTDRTKFLILNSPGNPTGVVLNDGELRDLVDLCQRRNVLLLSDEIYDLFTYEQSLEGNRCPSPARFTDQMLLIRGFGKSYGCTGWRLGYAAGPKSIIQQMLKLQQYTFTCAPSMAQVGVSSAFEVNMSTTVRDYQLRRDMVVEVLSNVMRLNTPGGAFYAFAEVPTRLNMTATEFSQRAIERNVLVIPGGVFSRRDTHIRISFATNPARLRAGLEILRELASG